MKRIGIIGLGSMGLAMAKNIVDSGFPLTGFDLRQESLGLLEAAGGEPSGDAGDSSAAGGGESDEKVVDAEFEEVDPDKDKKAG